MAVRVHLPLVTRDDVQLSRATRHAPWKAKARGCLSPCTAWRRVLFSADEVEEALHLRPWPGGISGIVRRWWKRTRASCFVKTSLPPRQARTSPPADVSSDVEHWTTPVRHQMSRTDHLRSPRSNLTRTKTRAADGRVEYSLGKDASGNPRGRSVARIFAGFGGKRATDEGEDEISRHEGVRKAPCFEVRSSRFRDRTDTESKTSKKCSRKSKHEEGPCRKKSTTVSMQS